MSSYPSVLILGALNGDNCFYVSQLPRAGETVHANASEFTVGGKALNTAAQVAKLCTGDESAGLMGAVGSDASGQKIKEALKGLGGTVNTTSLLTLEGKCTGSACVMIDANGENCIVISPGANGDAAKLLELVNSISSRELYKHAKVLIGHAELPLEVTIAAFEIAKKENPGIVIMFNPSPTPKKFEARWFDFVSCICVNLRELAVLTGCSCEDGKESSNSSSRGVRELLEQHDGASSVSVVVTMGARGCLVATRLRWPEGPVMTCNIPAPEISDPVVSTVGAGDSFIGALGYFMAAGLQLEAAAEKACVVASASVAKMGTVDSYALRKQLPSSVFEKES